MKWKQLPFSPSTLTRRRQTIAKFAVRILEDSVGHHLTWPVHNIQIPVFIKIILKSSVRPAVVALSNVDRHLSKVAIVQGSRLLLRHRATILRDYLCFALLQYNNDKLIMKSILDIRVNTEHVAWPTFIILHITMYPDSPSSHFENRTISACFDMYTPIEGLPSVAKLQCPTLTPSLQTFSTCKQPCSNHN